MRRERQIAREIAEAQAQQEREGASNPGRRIAYHVPEGASKFWLWFYLPLELYKRIDWTPLGAVFLARK